MDTDVKLYFQINPTSGVPIYRQIFDQVRIGIAMRKFMPGDFLPSIRDVSKSLEVNPMTVSKAYSLLEKNGSIEFIRGQGMRVPQNAADTGPSGDGGEQLIVLIREVVNNARQLSLDKGSVIKKLDDIWEEDRHAECYPS